MKCIWKLHRVTDGYNNKKRKIWFRMDKNTEERISRALDTLKRELIEMRHMDVKLMRQLLSINDTIQKMTKCHTMTRTQSCKSRISTKRTHKLSPTKGSSESPIRRLQSTPSFCRLNSSDSYSSLESPDDKCSADNIFYFEECDEDMMLNELNIQRFNSMTCLRTLDENVQDDSCYEEILKANIKVWKSSQENDSSC